MSSRSQSETTERAIGKARVHRALAVMAVLHAFVVLAAFQIAMSNGDRWLAFAVGSATVWFCWPLILALHPGASRLRAYVATSISAAALVLPMIMYFRHAAPVVFTPGELMSFAPYDLASYTLSYARGWLSAKHRARADVIVLEGYGFGRAYTPGAPPFSTEAQEKYHIQVEAIAGCAVGPRTAGHARGYNAVSVAELKRRYGPGVIAQAEREEAARQQRWQDMHKAGETDAENDIRSERLALVVYGEPLTGEEQYRELLRDRYQIELRRISDSDQPLDQDTWAHAQGYNYVMSNEVRRRFGEEASLVATWVTGQRPFDDLLQRLEFFREHGR